MKQFPSEGELILLHILWDKNEATVKEVFEEVRKVKRTGYTTTLKLMQIMLAKKFVKRDTTSKNHLYKATIQRSTIEKKILSNLIRQHFRNDPKQLVKALMDHDFMKESDLRDFTNN